jgi:Kef-type K+ transport system membrane component KefB
MQEKLRAASKYISDICKAIGLSGFLFMLYGLTFSRDETNSNLQATIVIGVLGVCFIVAGLFFAVYFVSEED